MAVPGVARPTSTPLSEIDRLVRPTVFADQRTLPVTDTLLELLPGGLPRGVTMTVTGGAARSLALAITARASQTGSWIAAIGFPGLGWQAAAELGVAVARLVAVDHADTTAAAECVAAALDGFDIVLVGTRVRLGAAVRRRLTARARERGSVLLEVHDPWESGRRVAPAPATRSDRPTRHAGDAGRADGADLRATATVVTDETATGPGSGTTRGGWSGIGTGTGLLRARRVDVTIEGKRLPGRRRRADLWLPGPDGASRTVEPMATVVPVGHRRVPTTGQTVGVITDVTGRGSDDR